MRKCFARPLNQKSKLLKRLFVVERKQAMTTFTDLEIERQNEFPSSSFTLSNEIHSMVGRTADQYANGCIGPCQSAMEPWPIS